MELKLLHLITADPARTPTFIMFANPNYFLFAGAPNCTSPCVTLNPRFAWNHGTVSPEITTTWLGMVGPGVNDKGTDGTTWSDHTDIRATMLLLLGLKDDYPHQGRVLIEELTNGVIPQALQNSGQFIPLAQILKHIDAPVGQLALASLVVSTRALESNDAGDATYNQLENQLVSFTNQRDDLAAQMLALLEGAEFNGQTIDQQQAQQLISQAQALLNQVNSLAGNPCDCH